MRKLCCILCDLCSNNTESYELCLLKKAQPQELCIYMAKVAARTALSCSSVTCVCFDQDYILEMSASF